MRTVEFDRDQVLDLALAVFWEKGYAEASIQDLTEATGLQRSSLYNTFTGKRELYLAALRRYHARCTEQYALIECSSRPVEAICALVRSVIEDELGDSRGLGCMVANAALEFSGRDDVVRALTSYNLTTMADTIAAGIRRAQECDQVSDSLDPEAFARSIVVTVQGLRVVAKGVDPGHRTQWLVAAADTCLAPLRR